MTYSSSDTVKYNVRYLKEVQCLSIEILPIWLQVVRGGIQRHLPIRCQCIMYTYSLHSV